MLNQILAFSLKNRMLIVTVTLVMAFFGGYQALQLPIDVFPDLNRPTVTIMTEAHGLAPEEVETLVTLPIESALNGATGVKRVRSASGIGISIVWVEFEWDTEIDRQVISEKLQLVRSRLPNDVNPTLAPITSIMGEIMLVGLQAAGETAPMQLRTIAEWDVRRRLLAISGIAQVTIMGGELKQYQVLTSPERLAEHDVTLDELTRAVEKSNSVMGGGFLLSKNQESLIRLVGRINSLDDLRQTVVRLGEQTPITVRQVADVRFAGPVKRGEGSINGDKAVIMSIQKQPGADTLALTRQIEETLTEIQRSTPGVKIDQDVFRQANFIQVAIGNVVEAIVDGGVWVIVVLFIFLWNFRTSIVTITAIPLSIILTALSFRLFDISINTMTLGGLAVAIGELVDDSIVDIENIYRRLKENRLKAQPLPALKVIYSASSEIRNSIVYATLIVVLVVFPLFSLTGLEGRMFAPLGLSYLTTLLASLLVSLTVTPVLSSFLLPKAKFLDHKKDPFLVRCLKKIDTVILKITLRHNLVVLFGVAFLVIASSLSLLWMGGEFLPDFNEGTLTIGATCPPGTSLEESDRIGRRVEQMLLAVPGVEHVSRRTGRAELDEHAENVNYSEIEASLQKPERPKSGPVAAVLRGIPGLHTWGVEHLGRPRDEVVEQIRESLAEVPGVSFNIGQPISHRLDHIMSGIRAQIAVKLFGQDLDVLRGIANEIALLMSEVPGVVDLQVEQQVNIPQIRITVKREEASRYGLAPDDVAETLETALQGRVVSQVLDGQKTFDLVVWFDEAARNDIELIRSTLISTPLGARVSLGSVAEVVRTTGPNTINHENVTRRIVVQANTAGRDLVSVVKEIQAKVSQNISPSMPEGYFLQYGGQFEAQQKANLRLLILGAFSVLGIFLLLCKCLESWRGAAQVMVNIPLAGIGSVIALLLVNRPPQELLAEASFMEWPRIWIQSTTLSVAHWVGFITLIGIVSRNGIMMISHYIHLMKYEGEKFGEQMIIRGSLERLAPVMMTALTTMIGLLPLAMGAGQTGKEILHPLAIVVIGGLLSSTLLDQIVTPALFFRFGRKVYAGRFQEENIESSDRINFPSE